MFCKFFTVFVALLFVVAVADGDVVLSINYDSEPFSSGPFSDSFDSAGTVIAIQETITFDSLATKFGTGGTAEVAVEIFEGTPSSTTGTSNLTLLGSASTTVATGTFEFDLSNPIEFVAGSEYLVGFKHLSGIGVNYKVPFSGGEQFPFFSSALGVTGEFRDSSGTVAPILQFSNSAIPEPGHFCLTIAIIGAVALRRRKPTLGPHDQELVPDN